MYCIINTTLAVSIHILVFFFNVSAQQAETEQSMSIYVCVILVSYNGKCVHITLVYWPIRPRSEQHSGLSNCKHFSLLLLVLPGHFLFKRWGTFYVTIKLKCFVVAMSLSLPVTEQRDQKDRLLYICKLYNVYSSPYKPCMRMSTSLKWTGACLLMS